MTGLWELFCQKSPEVCKYVTIYVTDLFNRFLSLFNSRSSAVVNYIISYQFSFRCSSLNPPPPPQMENHLSYLHSSALYPLDRYPVLFYAKIYGCICKLDMGTGMGLLQGKWVIHVGALFQSLQPSFFIFKESCQ